jgi:MOSC domain-containing protein YiiM
MTAQILSISVGTCQPLLVRGSHTEATRQVLSGIRKNPVSDIKNPAPVFCGAAGLEGDEQADLTVHGGLDKAIYCYPEVHYPFWQTSLEASEQRRQRLATHGALGENLTISELTEQQVYVGDIWEIGEVRLRVEQPREPCYKFNAVMGDRLASRKMFLQQASGWYLSVQIPGILAAGQFITVLPGSRSLTIAKALSQSRQAGPTGLAF